MKELVWWKHNIYIFWLGFDHKVKIPKTQVQYFQISFTARLGWTIVSRYKCIHLLVFTVQTHAPILYLKISILCNFMLLLPAMPS